VAVPDDIEGGTVWLSVPEAARYLGISERAVRKRIGVNTIPAEREGGGPWRVRVSTADAAPIGTGGGPTSGTSSAQGGIIGGTTAEPIEVAYRVVGEAAAEVALVPLATMVEELRGLADQLQEMSRRNESLALEVGQLRERQVGHAGEVAAKDETIATQRDTLATQAERVAEQQATIAELRRRAEAAEAELSRRREEEAARSFGRPQDQAVAHGVSDRQAEQRADATARAEGAEVWRGRMHAAALLSERSEQAAQAVQDGPGATEGTPEAHEGLWALVAGVSDG
jgi:excisionase family DNA binding protein